MKERLMFAQTDENVQTVARAILREMPSGWEMITGPYTNGFYLRPSHGEYKIYVSLREAPRKYSASVEFNIPNNIASNEVGPTEERPTCGTDFQRGPEPIAKSIIKKLLPFAEQQYPLIAEQIQNVYTRRNGRLEASKELCALCETSLPTNLDSDSMPIYGKFGIWQLKVNYDGTKASVNIRDSFPLEKVKLLIEFMRDNGFGK